jgi:zinc transport system permease protein
MTAILQDVLSRFMEFSFYQNALSAGLAIAVVCGLLSVFVVFRRMAFIGEGISHAAFGAIGLVLLLELNFSFLRTVSMRNLVIAIFLVSVSLFIGLFSMQKRVSEDSAIGIMLVTSMALGVLLINLRSDIYTRMVKSGSLAGTELPSAPSFHDILFGNILAIGAHDVYLMWLVALVISSLVLIFFEELMFFTFDEQGAFVHGIRTGALHLGLLVTLALAIFFAVRMVGVILATAFLIFPASISRLLSRRVFVVTFLSVLIAIVSVTLGLFASIALPSLSTGPVIVLVLFAMFVAAYLFDLMMGRS